MAINFVNGYNFTVVNALEIKLFLSALAWCLGADNVPDTGELPEDIREGFLADDCGFWNDPRVAIHNAYVDRLSVDNPKSRLHVWHMEEFHEVALKYYRNVLNLLDHCKNIHSRDRYFFIAPMHSIAYSYDNYSDLVDALNPILHGATLGNMMLDLADWVQNYVCAVGDVDYFRDTIKSIARALPTDDLTMVHHVEQAMLDARKARMEQDDNYF